MNVLEHLQTGDVSKAHLMRCLATQVNGWKPSWQAAFLARWKKDRGRQSVDELKALMRRQPDRDLLAGREALQQIKQSME